MSKFVIRPGVDVIAMLKDKGYSTYVIRRDKVLGESTVQKFRGDDKQLPSWAELAKLVDLLHVSPVDLIAFQHNNGVIVDLTGKRISVPTAPAESSPSPLPSPEPKTYIQHGHPGDDGYDPDDPGDQMPCDDDY
jgi:putative transcriptional regulator